VLAIAALLQGWLCVGVLCTLQMCCNVRSPMRDFELSILSLEGEWDAVLGLRTTFGGYPKGGTFTTKLDLKN